MPKDTRALTRAARARAATGGVPYTEARATELEIRDRMDYFGESYGEAEAFLADPVNRVACRTCGWTNGMLCPECPGCGCYTGHCSGWRHREFAEEYHGPEADECEECGADRSLASYDECQYG